VVLVFLNFTLRTLFLGFSIALSPCLLLPLTYPIVLYCYFFTSFCDYILLGFSIALSSCLLLP
jgi:hypothetical protein